MSNRRWTTPASRRAARRAAFVIVIAGFATSASASSAPPSRATAPRASATAPRAAATAPRASATARRASTAAANHVTITRDRAGIPHIRARDFVGLGVGEGYAFAQDNLCTLADDIVTVNGDRSRYFGPNGMAVNYSAGVSDLNRLSDLYWRYVKKTGIVQRWLRTPPPNGPLPQVLQLYRGFAVGYNDYLRSGKLRDPRCKGKPWVRPISVADLLLRGEQIVIEASAAQFITDIAGAGPPAPAQDTSAQRARRAQRGVDARALRTAFGASSDPSQGSNGIGLGARDTRSRHGLVLANPHFPWRGTERFWMAQLTVPHRYDVEGGTLAGFPMIGIGFNRHIAWTHTVSTSRRFVLYQLKLVPGDPLSYDVDGKPVKMRRVSVSVRFGSTRISHTFYTTRWGLVLNVPQAGYQWTQSTAYALYDAEAGGGARAANQYLHMGQANSVRSLFATEAKYLAIPTFNTLAADDRGEAYYGDVGATPNVSQAKINTCMPAGAPQLVFAAARVVTLDGSRSSCAPANDPRTPVKGIFNASHLPHLFRRDYVENSNDPFWLVNPSHPLTGFSPIIGLTAVAQNLRTRLGNEMIAERVAGTDGLGPRKFTIPTLQAMWQSDRSKLAELVLAALVTDCRAHPSAQATNGQTVDLTAACNALAQYNKTGSVNAQGGWLFSEWYRFMPTTNFWADSFDPKRPLSTPSKLNTSSPATLTALADAVQELQAHGLALNVAYGAVQHATRHRSRIPIHGCNTGCFNAINASNGLATTPVSQAPYGEVFSGSSLVITTELDPRGPTSEGILTYSQATDPTSPWFANMTRMYSHKRWVKLPFTLAQLRRSRPLPTLTLRVP